MKKRKQPKTKRQEGGWAINIHSPRHHTAHPNAILDITVQSKSMQYITIHLIPKIVTHHNTPSPSPTHFTPVCVPACTMTSLADDPAGRSQEDHYSHPL
jgi:hypothetical protein